jgi:hypothetical protein
MKESSNLKAGSKAINNSDCKSNKANEANSWRKGSVASTDNKVFCTPFKRERFNSEGNNVKAQNFYSPQQDNKEEIEIDMTNIKYPMTSKILIML